MNPKQAIKNRQPITSIYQATVDFCMQQEYIEIALHSNSEYPIIEKAHYKYIDGKHIMMIVGVSGLYQAIENHTLVSGMIFDKNDVGFKMTKRMYGKYTCLQLASDNPIIERLKEDGLYKKMIHHGAKLFQLELNEGCLYFSSNEIYTIDAKMQPSFASKSLSGKPRFENSRLVLMEYCDREVIFSTIIEDGIYYTLSRKDARKIEYIQSNQECKFYDGIENHFTSKITILDDSQIEVIFNKLKDTHNSYFKSMDGLVALAFQK